MQGLLYGAGAAAVLVGSLTGVSWLRSDPLEGLSEEDRALLNTRSARRRRRGPLGWVGQRLGPEIAAWMGPNYREFIEQRVLYAQSPHFADASDFFAMKARLLLIFGLGALGVWALTGWWLVAVVIVVVGFALPDLLIYSAGRARGRAIDAALPDFLDVLAVTVSAGLSFRSSLHRVTERFDGPLSEEMSTVIQHMEVGVSRREAFRRLRERTQSEPLDAFITAMIQAEELGAPLVDALEQIAEDMRQTRAQAARQEASRAAPKITAVSTIVMVPGTLALMVASVYFTSGIDFAEFLGVMD
ncbi:type II secretion system F family protein [Nesterenkonia alba]|uniref:type II secretion system F family protein n=1 Tax=Nesterenkonia alba TaxID=515814 RepID=UPI0003B3A9F5|nr:type II secretion system F family protein [Nesterenkonia alba]